MRVKLYCTLFVTLFSLSCSIGDNSILSEKINTKQNNKESLNVNQHEVDSLGMFQEATYEVPSDSCWDFGSDNYLQGKDFTPISFLESTIHKQNKNFHFMMHNCFPMNWVSDKDIDTLMKLVESKQECDCYLNPLSSYIGKNEGANLGGYAIILINSYRRKTKVDLGLYCCPETNNDSVKEIKEWWVKSNRKI